MDSLDLLMIKIGSLRHVQEAVAADLKAEIRTDVCALLSQGSAKTTPTDADIISLIDSQVQERDWVKADTGTPRYRSMGESKWIRQDQLVEFARSVRSL